MATSAPEKEASRAQDVFISYSRKDKEFVRRLDEALTTRGREAWVDWEGIRHAAAHNKRMVPIVARDVDARTVPEPIAKLNWIFAREDDDLEAAVDFLVSALETDLEWIHAHTRLLTRAIEWEAKKRSKSFVLRGEDLKSAEEWLAQAGSNKERQPSVLQTEYIIASRRAETRRQRTIRTWVGVAAAIAIILAVIAFRQAALPRRRSWKFRKLSRNQTSCALPNCWIKITPPRRWPSSRAPAGPTPKISRRRRACSPCLAREIGFCPSPARSRSQMQPA